MFDPQAAKRQKDGEAIKKEALAKLRNLALTIIPQDLSIDLILDINEVVCGDPSCAPIDTVVTLVWPSGKGMFAFPASAAEISEEEFTDFFPDVETLTKWKNGEKAMWPKMPELRFNVGDRVECRVSPHPVKGWAPGRITKLYYSEPSWPPNAVVPYQIILHDGRLIFAPQDTDNVIRARETIGNTSPEFNPEDFEDMMFDEDFDEEEEM